MSKTKAGDNVRVIFRGMFQDGQVFASSTAEQPFEFSIGDNSVIPGFEQAVLGMEPGQKKTVTVQPEHGFGIRQENLVGTIKRENLPQDRAYF